jgi:hypothetical protein
MPQHLKRRTGRNDHSSRFIVITTKLLDSVGCNRCRNSWCNILANGHGAVGRIKNWGRNRKTSADERNRSQAPTLCKNPAKGGPPPGPCGPGIRSVARPPKGLILHLPCRGNILFFRSEAGRTNGWAQAHFFVARGYSASWTGIGRGVFAWIWKKSARLPSGWRVRKVWKSLTSNGKLENNASSGGVIDRLPERTAAPDTVDAAASDRAEIQAESKAQATLSKITTGLSALASS